ncbi:MAG: electron transport complex subunit RsxC [Oscillospiraceae bacterium]|nr:electron transport complex subunit RsxC [Oscillospiraceae bacterium]
MKLRGIKVPHRKNTADSTPKRLPTPERVTIPMSMHIGKHAVPAVKIGERVTVGQLIAEANGFISAPVHSSVSGTVKKFNEIPMSAGTKTTVVEIETDGLQEISPDIKPPVISGFDSFVEAVKKSGVVGLGGAGFPTFVKLAVKDLSAVEAVIINAAECEPYITSDTRTMLDKTDYVARGIELLQKYICSKRIIIGIENNKKACIEKMNALAESMKNVEVKILPSVYPQGGEKVLVFNTLGRMIPKGGLPLDVGAIVINVTTLTAIAEYIETGMPLVEKCITVDGSAVKEPQNVIAPIGTPLEKVFEFCGGFKETPKKVLYGGPMMGISVPSLDVPVLKMTNAIIAFNEKDARLPKTTPCINCGKCLNQCPLKLDPRSISKAYKMDDCEELQRLHADLCMECGCCSFVCPAKRHLVQNNKLAKAKLNKYLREQQEENKNKEEKK